MDEVLSWGEEKLARALRRHLHVWGEKRYSITYSPWHSVNGPMSALVAVWCVSLA